MTVAPSNPAAQPFAFCAGATGILLLHGWLGLPGELRPLGEALAHRGYSVAAPLLAGHGAHPDALQRVRWADWYASALDAYAELAGRCATVVPIGYSLGGLLALHLAAHAPVAGVVTLAAALTPAGGWPLRALALSRSVLPWIYPFRRSRFEDAALRADLVSKMGPVDFDDPAVVARLQRTIRLPTRSIHEVLELGKQVRQELPRITAPALVVQGRLDQTVRPASAQQVYDLLGSSAKQLRWFERSGHLLPNDVEREQVWAGIADWLHDTTEN